MASSLLIDNVLRSSGQGPPLRVALMLDDIAPPGPQALAVELVRRCSFASIVLVVLRDEPGRDAELASGPRLLFDLYERWDRNRTRAASSLLAPVDLAATLAGISTSPVRPIRDGRALLLPANAVAELASLDLDVVLRLGFDGLAGDALGVARHGVWSYRQGDGVRYDGGPPHFWELAERSPLSGISLEAEGAPPRSRVVLCRGFASTAAESSGLSLARNRVKPQLLGATFAVAKLKELHEGGFAALERRATAAGAPPAPRRAPAALELARFLGPRLAGKARARVRNRREVVHWRVAVRVNGSPRLERGGAFGLEGFRWIDAPQGRLYADPCLVEEGGTHYCFFEDLDHATHRGRISCAALDEQGRFGDVRPVLELPYHLSYPLVFRDGGEWFMVPESRKNGTVDLFRAVEFPWRWRKEKTLFDAPGLDTTVLAHGGLYWFFVTVREPPGAGEQLLLFHSDALTGEPRFHRQSPISSDVRYCRSAGGIFLDAGRLVRPSQDCSVTYGHRLNFHEVVELTPDRYEERLITAVPPPPGAEGIHTYGRSGPFEVIDAKRMDPLARHVDRARLGAPCRGHN